MKHMKIMDDDLGNLHIVMSKAWISWTSRKWSATYKNNVKDPVEAHLERFLTIYLAQNPLLSTSKTKSYEIPISWNGCVYTTTGASLLVTNGWSTNRLLVPGKPGGADHPTDLLILSSQLLSSTWRNWSDHVKTILCIYMYLYVYMYICIYVYI